MSAPGDIQRATETRDDWETPQDLFLACQELFLPFTLDAAASPHNAKLTNYLSGPCEGPLFGCQCGLCADWGRNTVWLNPPYGELLRWVEKCIDASGKGASVMALLPASTDTVWFRRAWEQSLEVYFLHGRVPFVGTTSGSTIGSVLFLFRVHRPGFTFRRVVQLWDWRKGQML